MLYFEDLELNVRRQSAPCTITKDEIIAFATQWDPQPYHIDEEAAKQWPLGLSASTIHSYAISNRLAMSIATEPLAAAAGLGVDNMRTPHPVKPGDELHVESYFAAKRESASKPGMGVVTSVIELYNQNQTLVFRYETTTLVMRRPASASS